MSSSQTTNKITSFYPDHVSALQAVESLLESGFSKKQIQVAELARLAKNHISARPSASPTKTAFAGATVGGAAAGFFVGVAGLVVGLIAGSSAILGAGPLALGAAGTSAGIVAGGAVGGMIGFGIPSIEAHIITSEFRDNNIVVTVETQSDPSEVQDILEDSHFAVATNLKDIKIDRI